MEQQLMHIFSNRFSSWCKWVVPSCFLHRWCYSTAVCLHTSVNEMLRKAWETRDTWSRGTCENNVIYIISVSRVKCHHSTLNALCWYQNTVVWLICLFDWLSVCLCVRSFVSLFVYTFHGLVRSLIHSSWFNIGSDHRAGISFIFSLKYKFLNIS